MKIINDINISLSKVTGDELITLINTMREEIHKFSPFKDNPVDFVKWVKNDAVKANDYNPNAVAPMEMKLLETSIIEDGYTQPIVSWINDENKIEVVDGFHRNRVGKESETVKKRVLGYLPIVTIRDKQTDKSSRMASTIRHNRARGKHNIDAMSEIVLELKSRNWKTERICKELGMEEDEVLRLCQISGLTNLFSDVEFTEAWESDTTSSDTELDLQADFSAITQNTSDKDRIFHTVDKWEAVSAGFFDTSVKNKSKEECEAEYISFFRNLAEFEDAIKLLFDKWPNSCEHNLTNSSMNRIAWIGQAAICIKRRVPSCFRNGFLMLNKEEQDLANNLALKYLNIWLTNNGLDSVNLEEALSHRQTDLF